MPSVKTSIYLLALSGSVSFANTAFVQALSSGNSQSASHIAVVGSPISVSSSTSGCGFGKKTITHGFSSSNIGWATLCIKAADGTTYGYSQVTTGCAGYNYCYAGDQTIYSGAAAFTATGGVIFTEQ